jgi:hypothetical protein
MWTLVSGVITLVLAAIGARPVGRALKVRSIAWYVFANALVLALAIAIVVASTMIGVRASTTTGDVVYGLGLGLGFGGLAGLRYGYKGVFENAAGKGRS